MMTNVTDNSLECLNEDTLHKLASGECTPAELSGCEEHVSQCRNCRELLESRSLDASWHQDLLPAFHNSTSATITEREHHDSTLQDALKVLGPTDDPHMLGRIGSYEVVGLIGCGGMGVVFKAFDGALNRFVAIKIMQPHLAVSGAARQRFAREGRAAAAVINDCVLPIHAVSEWQGVPYLVMQYSAGMNLQKRIETEGPLKLTEILRVAMQTARGLAAAHAQGLVHRDVKPSNILLDGSVERAMLTDFGLARTVDDASVTGTGLIAGTPQYMSPEQVRGEKVDARSDLFSLGATMYAMCTGRSPFRGESTYSVLHRLTHDEPCAVQEVNAEIPSWLCAIINKLLSKQPDERYQSADELADLLEQCLAHVQQPTTASLPQCVAQLPSIVIPATAAANNSPHRQLEQLFGTRPPIIKWLAAAAFAFSLIFAGVLIVLELNKGTLTIECDADDVPIRIMQGDNVVERMTVSKSPQNVRIAAGNYVVEVDGDFQGVTIKDGKVSLTRHGVATVEISKNAKLVLASNFQPGNIDGLRFGGRHERIDPRNRGYANIQVAEPGETNKYFASFPTLGNGIEEVGLLVSVEPPHEPTEPSNWKSYLVRASGIRRIRNYSACEASVEGKSFFKLDDEPYTVGYFQLQLDGEEEENVTVDMIAGSAHVNINYVVGLPNEQVRKVLKLDAPNKHSESWLSVNLQTRPQSAWASHLMKLDGWEYDRTRGVPNMIQREVALRSGETQTVTIEPADVRDVSLATSSAPNFSTPDALMKHAADCQTKGDGPGFMDCWTDRAFEDFVPSYLLTSIMQLQYFATHGKPRHPEELMELKQILTEEFGGNEAGKSLLALALGHKEIADRSADKFAEAAEATAESPLVQLLASSSTNLINSRSFIMKLSALHEKYEEPEAKKEPRVFAYTVELDGDKAVATETTDKNKFGLIKTEAGWRINDVFYGLKEVADIQANAPLKAEVPSGSVAQSAAQSTELELEIFQRHLNTTDRIVNAFKSAAASARKDGKPLNSLYLLAALIRHGSVPAIAEIAEEKNIAMKDLMERCNLAAQAADAASIEQWQMLAATADDTAKQWKHDYCGTEHLLMALIADGTLTRRFLSEQGIEAAAIRDTAMQIYFSLGRDAPVVRPLPEQPAPRPEMTPRKPDQAMNNPKPKRLQIREAAIVEADAGSSHQSDGSKVVEFSGMRLRLDPAQPAILTEEDIMTVESTDPNNPKASQIVLTLTPEAGERFLIETSRLSSQPNPGYLVIEFDGIVLSAPRVNDKISSKVAITASKDDDMERLVAAIRESIATREKVAKKEPEVVAPDAPAHMPRIESVVVGISKDGEISLNRKKMPLAELKTRAARNAKKWFRIQAGEDVPYSKVVEVVEALKAVGVTEFSFSEARVGKADPPDDSVPPIQPQPKQGGEQPIKTIPVTSKELSGIWYGATDRTGVVVRFIGRESRIKGTQGVVSGKWVVNVVDGSASSALDFTDDPKAGVVRITVGMWDDKTKEAFTLSLGSVERGEDETLYITINDNSREPMYLPTKRIPLTFIEDRDEIQHSDVEMMQSMMRSLKPR